MPIDGERPASTAPPAPDPAGTDPPSPPIDRPRPARRMLKSRSESWLSTKLRHRDDADPASQGQSQIKVAPALVMEPLRGDSAERGWDDAREHEAH
jgi:hypothetical protein